MAFYDCYVSQSSRYYTEQKMKFSVEDFFGKCDRIRSLLWICSHLPHKSLENLFFLHVRLMEYFPTVNLLFLLCSNVSRTADYN